MSAKKDARAYANARLAAVQALYEMDLAGVQPDPVLREFFQDRWKAAEEEEPLVEPEPVLLALLVRGVEERQAKIDEMIGAALSGDWTVERIEALLRAILRAGTCELLMRPETPAKVAISEYVNVAHAFYTGGEPKMVNGVLDKIAKVLRGQEFGGA